MLSSLLVESSAGHSDFRGDGLRVLKVIGLTVSGPILVLLLAAPLVLLIFGQEYADVGAAPMRLLALSTIPYAVKSYATYLSRYERRMRRVINIEAGAAIPSLVLAVILAPVLGLVGLALAVLLAQTMIAVVVTATVLRPVIRGWQAARTARPPEGAA
jgi:O-antigen/teichoic acid export membrane protein